MQISIWGSGQIDHLLFYCVRPDWDQCCSCSGVLTDDCLCDQSISLRCPHSISPPETSSIWETPPARPATVPTTQYEPSQTCSSSRWALVSASACLVLFPSGNLPLSLVKPTRKWPKTAVHRLAARGWLQKGVNPIDLNVKMPNFTEEKNMFTAWCKKWFWSI